MNPITKADALSLFLICEYPILVACFLQIFCIMIGFYLSILSHNRQGKLICIGIIKQKALPCTSISGSDQKLWQQFSLFTDCVLLDDLQRIHIHHAYPRTTVICIFLQISFQIVCPSIAEHRTPHCHRCHTFKRHESAS